MGRTYLDGAAEGNDLVLHLLVPQAPLGQVLQQVGVHYLPPQNTSSHVRPQAFTSPKSPPFGPSVAHLRSPARLQMRALLSELLPQTSPRDTAIRLATIQSYNSAKLT